MKKRILYFFIVFSVFVVSSCVDRGKEEKEEQHFLINAGKPNLNFNFDTEKDAYYFLKIRLSSKSDWGNVECTSQVVDIFNNREKNDNWVGSIVLWKNNFDYTVFLGKVDSDKLSLKLSYSKTKSLCESDISVEDVRLVKVNKNMISCAEHLPLLLGFKDSDGIHNNHSDLPMFWVCDNSEEGKLKYILYYSNEDGGTGLAPGWLMFEWGRVADIENAFTVDIDSGKSYMRDNETKDSDFNGLYYNNRPLLQVITLNGLVGEGKIDTNNLLFSLPFTVSSGLPTREDYLELFPYSYEIMAKEMERENKITETEDPDPDQLAPINDYIYLDQYFSCNADNCSPEYYLKITLNDDTVIYSNDEKDKYLWDDLSYKRRIVKLPVGTAPRSIEDIEVCVNNNYSGTYYIYKMFMLNKDNLPDNTFIKPSGVSVEVGREDCNDIYGK